MEYVDLGADYYEQKYKEREIAKLVRKAARFGLKVVPSLIHFRFNGTASGLTSNGDTGDVRLSVKKFASFSRRALSIPAVFTLPEVRKQKS